MAMDGRLEVKGAGPTLVFHCYSTAPLHGVALSDLYAYLDSLLSNGISKYIVCTDDKQDRGLLTEGCARIPNCEVVFMSDTFYPFNVCDHLLWYLNRIIVPGTIILLTNIQEGYYYAAIKTIQGLGWHVILANQPTIELPQAIQAIKRKCQQVAAAPSSSGPSTASPSGNVDVQWVDNMTDEPDGYDHLHLRPVPDVIHNFLTGEVVPMTPLDLAGSRELMDNFQANICILDDWPFFPPNCPMPNYNSRKESRLMKLMDSLNRVDVDVPKQDVTDPQKSEREELGAYGSLSHEDSFFELNGAGPLVSLKETSPEKNAAGDKPNHRSRKAPFRSFSRNGYSLNRSYSTPPGVCSARKRTGSNAAR